MKAKTIFDLLKHFSEAELNEMEIQVVGGGADRRLSVQKLSVECLAGNATAYNRCSQDNRLLIIAG